MGSYFLIAICIVAFAASVQVKAESRIFWRNPLEVSTVNGVVKGFLKTTCSSKTPFAGFRGIPYAEPPVGDRRFKDPVAKTNWQGVWDATYERPSCFQKSMIDDPEPTEEFSEDCLYLNVYTPNLKYLENRLAPLKAVMVFIHMGAFVEGSSDESFSSPDFLLDQDVIVVNFNYRLGPLGFLSFQNADVPGNAGLKDQSMALKWVKHNIHRFGGDPNRITVFGQSAGSASIHYHLMSKSSAGLFRNAIMQSGSAMASWAYTPPELALKKALSLSKIVGCSVNTNMSALLDCMQKVPAADINDLQQKALTLQELLSVRGIAFNPTSEPNVPGAFITESPVDLMFEGRFHKVPTIIGSTADEGLLLYPLLMTNKLSNILFAIIGLDLSRFAPYQFNLKPFSDTAIQVHQEISRFYFNSKIISKRMILKVLELFTDSMFIVPIQLTAGLLAKHNVPVYNYMFTYEGNYPAFKMLANMTNVPGVCHGDDIGYLFYTPELHRECGQGDSKFSPSDALTIRRMTKMWTNFAKSGNPTPRLENDIPVKWKPFTSNEYNYLVIGKELVPSTSLKLANVIFWESLINKIIEKQNGETR